MTNDLQHVSIGDFDSLLGLNPCRVRSMSEDDVIVLAEIIRSFLIESVTKTGGHLGANLGVVELTIALHRSFILRKRHLYLMLAINVIHIK